MSLASPARFARVTALNIYPVKSCGGIALPRARMTSTGFEHDREWMIVRPNGRFVTQREMPKLATIQPLLNASMLQLDAPGCDTLAIDFRSTGKEMDVVVWRDHCKAIDCGNLAAAWLEEYLDEPLRLVRFDASHRRPSDRTWTGDVEAFNQFSDGFPWLLISEASLDALNARLARPLPMNRFRPNIVISGTDAFEEDAIATLASERIELRPVKPCTRCAITTTDQSRGERDGDEPLRTLRSFRFDASLKGVTFGQNAVVARGIGEWLEVGQELRIERRALGAG